MQSFQEWISKKDIISSAEKAKLNISKYKIDQITMGMKEELEHGIKNPKLNITNNDPVKTLKIVLAHLDEDPNYYSKLNKVL
jgi:hypothetical protein